MAQQVKRTVTIEDVARAAGVSRQTVSRAINDKGEISPTTRQRIMCVADELGYRPSRIARSLATRSSCIIGLVVPDIANPFFPEIARGVEEAAYAAGYQVILSNTAEDPDREWGILRSLEEQRVDGIILCSSRLSSEQLLDLAAHGSPLVLLNRQIECDAVSSLLVNDREGAWLATRHLLGKGHRTIGHLSGPARSWSALRRQEGYRAALLEAGIQPEDHWLAHGFPQVDGGREATHRLLARAPEITAILAYNDLMALGAVQACIQSCRPVPEKCAVVGFDDILLASLVTPALTTVRVDKHAAGCRAAHLLRSLIEKGNDGAVVETMAPCLIVREST